MHYRKTQINISDQHIYSQSTTKSGESYNFYLLKLVTQVLNCFMPNYFLSLSLYLTENAAFEVQKLFVLA